MKNENQKPETTAPSSILNPPSSPPAAEAKVIAKEAVKLAKEHEETLQTATVAAREGLGFALRVMIVNQVPETDAGRLLVENAFEAAKHASAGGKSKRADLVAAAAGLQHAENHLANRSLKFPGDLATVRNALRKTTGVLGTIPE